MRYTGGGDTTFSMAIGMEGDEESMTESRGTGGGDASHLTVSSPSILYTIGLHFPEWKVWRKSTIDLYLTEYSSII